MRFRIALRRSLLLAAAVALATAPAWAGRVTGTVTGADGEPLADVTVRLVPEDEALPAVEVRTNARGKFVFGVLRDGDYRLVVREDDKRVAHVKANLATPDDRSAWSVDEDLPPGAETPPFHYTSVADVTFDVRLEPASGGSGEFGTGAAAPSTQEIVNRIQAGDLDAALADIDRALETHPDAAVLHYLKGFVLRGREELDAAEAAARRAVELDPTFEGAHLLLGKILEGKADFDGALAAYEQERDVATTPQVQRDLYLAIGELHIRQNRLEDARVALERVLEVAPDTTAAYKVLADVYLRLGQPQKAQEMLAKVNELGGADPAVLFNMGAERYNAGDMEQASEYFRQAIEIDPGFADAYRQLGFTRLSLGDQAGAIENLKKYLELNPNAEDPQVETARSILAQLESGS